MRPQDVTKPILERWQRQLYLHRKPNGRPVVGADTDRAYRALEGVLQWLARENYILYNPASELDLPRVGRRLPKTILTVKEVEKVLARPRVTTQTGVRDRAMLEALYSTGLRRQELINLKLHDVDFERGVVMVREGKGRNDRMIPIGDRALSWIDKYVEDVRPDFASGADDGHAVPHRHGHAVQAGDGSPRSRGAISTKPISASAEPAISSATPWRR